MQIHRGSSQFVMSGLVDQRFWSVLTPWSLKHGYKKNPDLLINSPTIHPIVNHVKNNLYADDTILYFIS